MPTHLDIAILKDGMFLWKSHPKIRIASAAVLNDALIISNVSVPNFFCLIPTGRQNDTIIV